MQEKANQQLRTVEQQLRAVNQQLRSTSMKLLASEQRFRKYFEQGLIGMTITSTEKGWIEVNDVLCEMLGYTKEELRKMTWVELTHPDDLEADIKQYNRLLANEIDSYTLEKRFIHKDGHNVYTVISVNAYRNINDQSLVDILALVHDITESKMAEEKLRAVNQQLQASEQELRAANQQLIASESELNREKNFSEKIIDTASAIIVGFDKDHIIRLFNKGAEDITGYTKAEVIGKDWFKIFFPKELLNEMNKVWEGAWEITAHSYINSILCKTGNEIIVSWQTTGIYEGEDVSKHLLISIGEDITERKRAEEEVTKLSKIVETTSQHIVLTKTDGTVVYVNKAHLDVSGYKESEVIGSSMFDLTDEEGMKILKEETIPQILSSGHWHGEMVVKVKDGTKFSADLTCSVIKNKDGEPEYFVAVFNDITERKQAEEEIKKRMKELEIFNEAAVGRELKIIELKKEINELLAKSGQKPKYEIIE